MDSLKVNHSLEDKIRERAHLEVVRASGWRSTLVYPVIITLLAFTGDLRHFQRITPALAAAVVGTLSSGLWRLRLGGRILREEGKSPPAYLSYQYSVMITALIWSGYACTMVHFCAGEITDYLAVLSSLAIVAGSTSTLTPDLNLLRAYMLVMIVPAGLQLALEGGRSEEVTGLMVVAFTTFVWSTGKVHHQRFMAWLRYNHLLDMRTQQLQESRRQAAEMLQQEITQGQLLSQQNLALDKARGQAEVANRSKSAFLAAMSHEIRTPMNAIVTLSDLLQETPLNSEQRDWVETIKQGCDSLLSLISDVLDMAKIEADRVELIQSEFSPAELCQELTRLLQANANQKGLELHSYTAQEVMIRGDRHRLRQVLLNLLGNAIKFTPRGFVKFSLDKQADTLEFCVSDSGMGLSEPEKLFQPFSQLDTSSTRQFGGTGLGLAISLRLAELMKGWLWAESRGCLAGTPPPGWSPDPARSDRNEGSRFYLRIPLITAPDHSHAAGHSPVARPAARPLNILVVEDNPVNQKVLGHLLDKLGHSHEVVEDGLAALEVLKQHAFEVILMDLQMPRLDGLETCRRIRAGGSTQPWIIAVTANAFEEDRRHCQEVGMNDFLTKPLRREALSQALLKVPLRRTDVLEHRSALDYDTDVTIEQKSDHHETVQHAGGDG